MIKRLTRLILFVSLSAPLLAQPAPAPVPSEARKVQEPPRGVSGSVVSVSDSVVVLKQKDGTNVSVPMTRGWTVSRPRKSTITEVRIGDFVGSASVDLATDKGKANELRVFEPGYRPEYGTHSMAAPGVSMTHGFVFAMAKAEGGTVLDIAYPDGRRAILLPEGMVVTVSDLLPRSVLTPGTAVTGVTRPGPDGVRRASRLTLPTPQQDI